MDTQKMSLEELIQIASTGQSEQTDAPVVFADTRIRCPVLQFVVDLQIQEPSDKPQSYANEVIYKCYKRIWRPYSKGKLNRIEFFRRLCKIFKPSRTGKTRYYKFNQNQHLDKV